MASLLEHVMINKLGDDLNDAILAVGGDTSSVDHIMDYPEIIKTQLINRDGHECNPGSPDNPGSGDVTIDINQIISEVVNSDELSEKLTSMSESLQESLLNLGDDEGIKAEILQWEDTEDIE